MKELRTSSLSRLSDAFKKEILKLVDGSRSASTNYRYRDQIINAAWDAEKNIIEGFGRKQPLVFANFLDYAVASILEAAASAAIDSYPRTRVPAVPVSPPSIPLRGPVSPL